MSKYNEDFEPIELSIGTKRVTWVYIGEGFSGDYDSKNPNDIPLLRFSCEQLTDEYWEVMEDSSYCTQMPIDTPLNVLVQGMAKVMKAIQGEDYKQKLGYLSWMEPKSLNDLVLAKD